MLLCFTMLQLLVVVFLFGNNNNNIATAHYYHQSNNNDTIVDLLSLPASNNNNNNNSYSSSLQQSVRTLASIDELILSFMSDLKLTGLACAIVKGNKLVHSKGYGTANIRQKSPVTSKTPFLVASVSKTITGVALMQLVEQGLIDLDADISLYLPYTVKNPRFRNPPPITTKQLLSHTSSIVDRRYDDISYDYIYVVGKDHPMPLTTFCKNMFQRRERWYSQRTWAHKRPGRFYDYSNVGVALIGCIVENVTQQLFYEYCQKNIFTPLGMTSTSWRLADFDPSTLAMPYDRQNEPYGHYTFADYPNGGLRTTVEDMSVFLRMFMLDGTSADGTKILEKGTVQTMKTEFYPNVRGAEGQRLIWYDSPSEKYNVMGHSGGEDGVAAEMFYNPLTNTGVIYFINNDDDGIVNKYEIRSERLVDELIEIAEKM